jgi:hypothetical protein
MYQDKKEQVQNIENPPFSGGFFVSLVSMFLSFQSLIPFTASLTLL